ncbi:hypothetical protein MiSe_93150 [Microseira wollei NIES-4236]|uniref:Uncharacterized protein n=1 Tax=Microseira wollei NIES-4236 TaxID=2530354 RepID=A0AAV3XT90_9CYAN|nr:hypothetical protein MiSe_93150 [Microseira wollei NIES-4236]
MSEKLTLIPGLNPRLFRAGCGSIKMLAVPSPESLYLRMCEQCAIANLQKGSVSYHYQFCQDLLIYPG